MGVMFSCPVDDYDPLEEAAPAPETFSSSSGGVVEPPLLRALGSGKLLIEGSLSFKRRQAASGSGPGALQVETKISIRTGDAAPLPREVARARFAGAASAGAESPKHEAAALKLQKVYKSFRTRRQLADCAVLVEQRWWKLLDFALLKRSSVSFFDIEKQETAMSKWSRARTRVAKVGKGLLKDEKAQKLALQHWLEAIDPRHRYGHNLHYYYDCWLHCESKQPFFYWLDVGEGREINLEGKCSRSKLLSQCIKYLGPMARGIHHTRSTRAADRSARVAASSQELACNTNGISDSDEATQSTRVAAPSQDEPAKQRGRKVGSQTKLAIPLGGVKVALEPSRDLQFSYVNFKPTYKYTTQLGIILKREYPGVIEVKHHDGVVLRKHAALDWADYFLNENDLGETSGDRVLSEFWRLFEVRVEDKNEADRVLDNYLKNRVREMMHQAFKLLSIL